MYEDAVATARAFAERAGALRVVLLVDRGDEQDPLMVDCDARGDAEVTDGDALTLVAAGDDVGSPVALPDVRAIPATAISIDTETGELAAPLGAVEQLVRALQDLAQSLGGRSVATAEIATAGLPITLAARPGEPAVLAAGEREFRLPG